MRRPPPAHPNTWSSVTDWFGKDYVWRCWKGYHWGWVLRFQRLTHSQLPTPLPLCPLTAFVSRCQMSAVLAAKPFFCHHGLIKPITCFLLQVVLIKVFCHSNGKVTKTQGNNSHEILNKVIVNGREHLIYASEVLTTRITC